MPFEGFIWMGQSSRSQGLEKFFPRQPSSFCSKALKTQKILCIFLSFTCRIGHDNKGGGAAWFVDKVVVECPSLGRNWTFPVNRWLAKNKGDNQLEVELFPQELATEEYEKCMLDRGSYVPTFLDYCCHLNLRK